MSHTPDSKESVYIIRADEIAAMEGLAKTHFLNSNAKRINKSLGDLVGLTGFGFHLIEVEPGHETSEFHAHHYEDEAIFILDGEATAEIDGTDHTVSSGDFLGYRKGGAAHNLRNSGDTTLRCLVVGERLSHDVCDYPKLQKRLYRNAGMEWDVVDHADLQSAKGAGKK
jgi:uncharacterized cupin superfamily protein